MADSLTEALTERQLEVVKSITSTDGTTVTISSTEYDISHLTKEQRWWIRLLVSSVFSQNIEILGGDAAGYCCLGLSTVLYEFVTGERFERDENRYVNIEHGYYNDTIVHEQESLLDGGYEKVLDFMKLNEKQVVARPDVGSLVDLNDIKGYSFEQIARHCIENAKEVFVQDE